MLIQKAPLRGRFFLLQMSYLTLGGFFFLGSWLAPNHYPPWTSFHNEAMMFAAVIIFSLHAVNEAKSMKAPWLLYGLTGALIVLIWLQFATGLIAYGGDALTSTIYLVATVLAWRLGAGTVVNSHVRDSSVVFFAILVVIAAVASTLLGVLQWLQLETVLGVFAAERGPNMRPYANIAQPNLLATLLVMGTVFGYLLYARRLIRKWQLVVLTLILSFGLVITESRAGLLSAVCVGAFLLIRGESAWFIGKRLTVILWWLQLLVLSNFWRPLNEMLLLQPVRQVIIGVDSVRMLIWKQTVAAIWESPWIGYGWRQTIVAQKVGVDSIPGSAPTDYAHNFVLDILTWVGIPLGVLMVLAALWWLLRTIRQLKDVVELLLFSATIPILVHSMFEFPFAYAFFLFPMAWLFGALHVRQHPSQYIKISSGFKFVQLLSTIAVFAFAALCSQIAIEYFEAEEDCRVMRFEMRNVGSRPVDYESPRLVLLTQLDEMLKMGRIKPRRQMPFEEIERMRKANLSLAWGSLHLNYIIALGLNGRPDEATKQLNNLSALYGDTTYRSAVEELHRSRDEKYPELSLILTN